MHLPLSFVFFCVYFWLCQPIVLIFETDIKNIICIHHL